MEPDSRRPPRPPLPAAVSISLDDPGWCRAVREPARLARRAAAAARALARAQGRLAVALADDASLRGLNARFRGRDHATNVLSFPSRQGLGDVILARRVVLREARAEGVSAAARLAHLVVHGVLHLAGFDHANPRAARAMEAAEAAALRRLGLSNPWRRR
ncbi:MAG: rRNA maturation RNase YbeY [Acetobacteraceae bacterium]|nr:rRNA maturation RNase YbeY [Acetobacteraceae bacterium]